jgi:hypothetical protein
MREFEVDAFSNISYNSIGMMDFISTMPRKNRKSMI